MYPPRAFSSLGSADSGGSGQTQEVVHVLALRPEACRGWERGGHREGGTVGLSGPPVTSIAVCSLNLTS